MIIMIMTNYTDFNLCHSNYNHGYISNEITNYKAT